jgi:hypothetical protein
LALKDRAFDRSGVKGNLLQESRKFSEIRPRFTTSVDAKRGRICASHAGNAGLAMPSRKE